MDNSVQVFSSRNCGWAKRNYAALLEKGVEFTLLSANDATGQRRPGFLSLSPSKKTPVLKHRDVVVWESRIINEYIEEAFSGYSLMPADPVWRARARNWCCFCDDELIPSISQIVKEGPDSGGFEKFTTAVTMLDKFAFPPVSTGPYWAGSEFSLVDICYLNFFDNLVFVKTATNVEEIGLSRRIKEWWFNIDERPSVIHARKIAEDFALKEEQKFISL